MDRKKRVCTEPQINRLTFKFHRDNDDVGFDESDDGNDVESYDAETGGQVVTSTSLDDTTASDQSTLPQKVGPEMNVWKWNQLDKKNIFLN